MRRLRNVMALIATAAACGQPVGPEHEEAPPAEPAVRALPPGQEVGRYIVVLRSPLPDVAGTARMIVTQQRGTLHRVWQSKDRGFLAFYADLDASSAARLRSHPLIAAIEPEKVYYPGVNGTQTPIYANGWGLDNVDGLLNNNAFTYKRSGKNVRLYVYDSGILASHGQLAGRVASGFTTVSDGRGTGDCSGHGTQVAGIAAGTTYGVAKEATMVPVRIFGCSGGAGSGQIMDAIMWVNNNAVRPAVANMSLYGPADATLELAVSNSIAGGITYVVGSGNGTANDGVRTNACSFWPGRVPSAITVGATTANNSAASFSNFGTCVDMLAPGNEVRSSTIGSTGASAVISGTSFSTPFVTGAAAQYLEAFPLASPSQVASALTSNATLNLISNAGSGTPNRFLSTAFVPGVLATISGPTTWSGGNPWTPTNVTWTAMPQGGSSYTYQWFKRACGGTTVSAGTSQSATLGLFWGSADFWLKVVVTSGGLSYAALVFVDNTHWSPGLLTCPQP